MPEYDLHDDREDHHDDGGDTTELQGVGEGGVAAVAALEGLDVVLDPTDATVVVVHPPGHVTVPLGGTGEVVGAVGEPEALTLRGGRSRGLGLCGLSRRGRHGGGRSRGLRGVRPVGGVGDGVQLVDGGVHGRVVAAVGGLLALLGQAVDVTLGVHDRALLRRRGRRVVARGHGQVAHGALGRGHRRADALEVVLHVRPQLFGCGDDVVDTAVESLFGVVGCVENRVEGHG